MEKTNHKYEQLSMSDTINDTLQKHPMVEISLDENDNLPYISQKENVKCVRNIDKRIVIFTFILINLLNSTIFSIVNITNYDTDPFHNYTKLIYNIYLIGDNFIQCLYIYKKIYYDLNKKIKSINNKINYIIISYATITIGYSLYIGLYHFNILNISDIILCLLMVFRYTIYVLQLI